MNTSRKDEQIMIAGDFEARTVQVGETAPLWSINIIDRKSGLPLRTPLDDVGDKMFQYDGFTTTAAARAEAERLIKRENPTVSLGQWKPI